MLMFFFIVKVPSSYFFLNVSPQIRFVDKIAIFLRQFVLIKTISLESRMMYFIHIGSPFRSSPGIRNGLGSLLQ